MSVKRFKINSFVGISAKAYTDIWDIKFTDFDEHMEYKCKENYMHFQIRIDKNTVDIKNYLLL